MNSAAYPGGLPPARDPKRPFAAIDLGTHTALLLVCRPGADSDLEVVHDELAFARLGVGLAKTGRLSVEASERTLRVLAGFLERAAALGTEPRDLRAVGTAVLRRAADASEFVARCRSELGLDLEVISGAEEARLGHLAVAEPGVETLTVDAGGASTEIAWAGGAERVSIPRGALLLTERYLGHAGEEPVQAGGWAALRAELRAASQAFPAGVGAGAEVVMLGGTATNLACLELSGDGLRAFDHELAEGVRVPAAAADRWADRLADLDPKARLALPIEPERAEVLPAGLACLAAALERIAAREARATRRGLRYGIAREMLAARR